MDAERVRAFLRSLPDVVETESQTKRWGNKLVFRIGAQSIGGRMFSQIDVLDDGRAVLSFAANPENFDELTARVGVIPAPYRARIHWVALTCWDALRDAELKGLLREARLLTLAKLPKSVRATMRSDL
jgi:predicted DNA-binding protein (MmcQ/YjbR family)